MEKYIKKYIEQGIKVFSCNADKTPYPTAGLYAASTDFNKLQYQFFDLEKMLIGLPTGTTNQIIVVDIDINKKIEGTDIIDTRTVDELLEELKTFGEVPDTFQTETPSGGRHFWFLSDNELKISSRRRFFSKDLPIDVRAEGGYVCAPDGKNYIVYDDVDGLDIENIHSRCTPLPEWIKNFKKPINYQENSLICDTLPKSEIIELRSALSFISSDDRDMWVKIGMALKSSGSLSARGLWDEWSQKSEKYNPKDQESKWKSFKPNDLTIATIFHEAKNLGWITTYEMYEIQTNCENQLRADYKDINILPAIKKQDRKPFPAELLEPPGLVGDMVKYMNERAIKNQPILSIGGALAAVGALAGRKVMTDTNIRTNIYCISVGASGCGKDSVRKTIKQCFKIAGCSDLAAHEDLASDSAIITALNETPSQVFLIDEIGRFLKVIKSSSNAHYLQNIVGTLMKLYSSSDSEIVGKSYADKEKKLKIENPNLCIYGTTVPDTLYQGLSMQNITDGFLSRVIVFESEDPDPPKKKRRTVRNSPPEKLIEKIHALHEKKINYDPEGNIDDINSKPQIINLTENAVDMLERYDEHIRNLRLSLRDENNIDSIYSRTSQMAEQVALILAVGINIDNPVITEKEMEYAIKLTQYQGDNMLNIARNYVADNDFHRLLKEIKQIISLKGTITATELTKKTQKIPGYMRNDILNNLEGSGEIAVIEAKSGDKITKVITIV